MQPGTLFVVATPIGNLEDITLCAIRTLREVDYIACEDTRHSGMLLNHFDIKKKLIALHDFNESILGPKLLNLLKDGSNIALISDAGTPLINDPGYKLIKLLSDENINIVPIPGPCALITALCAAGLPTDKFIFAGFLPAKQTQRLIHLDEIKSETRTIIFYETPHRILATIKDMLTVFGKDRKIVLARELTKKFETVFRADLASMLKFLESDPNQQKGEFVIILNGAETIDKHQVNPETQKILKILSEELPPTQAAKIAAKITGLSKNQLYKLQLEKFHFH